MAEPPRHPPSHTGTIPPNITQFRHPHYDDTRNILLQLPRTEAINNRLGVHHGTALVACQIIANNAFSTGSLALGLDGEEPVLLNHDDILTDESYYFFVAGPYNRDNPYPIVPSFQDWEFPHNRIPEAWPLATVFPSSACGVTGYPFPVQGAHLVPQKQSMWFDINGMGRYADNRFVGGDVNNRANLAPLRTDIHNIFDDRLMGIVPRQSLYLTAIMSDRAEHYFPQCHNIIVHGLHKHAREYLFARFAWMVIFSMKAFVCQGLDRRVIQISTPDPGKASTYNAAWVQASVLHAKYSGGGTQDSGSAPKSVAKRQKPGDAMDDDDDDSGDDRSVTDIINTVYTGGGEAQSTRDQATAKDPDTNEGGIGPKATNAGERTV